jgi:hypothetical protein
VTSQKPPQTKKRDEKHRCHSSLKV